MENNNNNNDDMENEEGFFDYLPADHPLMQKMQAAMEKNLRDEEEKLRLEHKEKQEELKKIRRMREDIGVNLYSLQQQLAKLQEQLDNKKNKLRIRENQRQQLENTLKGVDDIFKNKKSSVKEQEKMVIQASEELNQLNRMLKYVEDYNIQVKSEIKVTKTSTTVVEKKMVTLEKGKKEQDFLIDHLMEQIKNLSEKKLLYEGQLKSQQSETQEARINLSEAQEETQKIMERKKNLLKDWNKSLISMKSRDKALEVVRDNIKEQEDERIKVKQQIYRYTELFNKEKFEFSDKTFQLTQIKNKKKHINFIFDQNNVKKEKLENKRNLLNTAANRTKEEIHQMETSEVNLRAEIELIDKNKLKLLNEARALNDKNVVVLSSKETHEKQAENLTKKNQKLNKEIFDIQVEIDSKLNDISRVEIDTLNAITLNDTLSKKLKLMNNEITNLETDLADNEAKIKRNHEDLDKKQLTVDRLNKKYGELTKNKGGEDEGELEVKIKEKHSVKDNLNNSIKDTEDQWIKKKTTLVEIENQLFDVRSDCMDKRSKKTILEHKRLRLNRSYEMHDKEIREIEISLKNLRYDMNKYNGLLSKNSNSIDKLSHQFFDVEIEFKEKLKQLENESVRMEIEIEVLREEKSDILTQILETERQIHLWDRKIKLEEEMQKIIKPDKGVSDLNEMKTFIHTQELEYNKLKKDQDDIIKEMEITISRREYVKLKYTSSNKFAPQIKNINLLENKEISKLKSDLKFASDERKKFEKIFDQRNEEYVELKSNIEKIQEDNKKLKYDYQRSQISFYNFKIKKNNLTCKTVQNQSIYKLIDDFIANKYKNKNNDSLTKELNDYILKNNQILDILRNVRGIYTSSEDAVYREMIDNVLNL